MLHWPLHRDPSRKHPQILLFHQLLIFPHSSLLRRIFLFRQGFPHLLLQVPPQDLLLSPHPPLFRRIPLYHQRFPHLFLQIPPHDLPRRRIRPVYPLHFAHREQSPPHLPFHDPALPEGRAPPPPLFVRFLTHQLHQAHPVRQSSHPLPVLGLCFALRPHHVLPHHLKSMRHHPFGLALHPLQLHPGMYRIQRRSLP